MLYSLCDIGLTYHIPDELFNLCNLKDLRLDDNKLTYLSKEIGSLVNLTVLSFHNNQITEIPKEIGSLVNLTRLSLSNNQITEVPKEIGNLVNLTGLSLSNNQITEIPKEIGSLINLTIGLELENNQITEVPKEIGSLVNLTGLSLSNNQITELPKEICNLTNLKELYLYNNQLTRIPRDIRNLVNLTILALHNNKLTRQPKEITSLIGLTGLSLDNNQLTDIPRDIGSLVNLTILTLHNNQLIKIPKEIGNLTNLTTLWLYNNQLAEIPKEIRNLTNLKELFLNKNPNLSLTLEQKEWIKELKASGCKVKIDTEEWIINIWNWADTNKISEQKIPRAEDKLLALTTLDFYNMGLYELPKELCQLQNITTLILWDNNIKELPQEIVNFLILQKVNLRGNPLSFTKEQLQWLDTLRDNGCAVYIDESNYDALEVVESFNLKPTKTVYKISTDQNKAIEFEDNIQAWVDADTALMWEVKTKENIQLSYVWSKEEIKNAMLPKELTDDVKDVFSYAKKLNTNNHAGFSDWRVPTLEELETLLTKKRSNDYYIKYPLSKNAACKGYWSSTTNAGSTANAWGVSFYYGGQSGYDKTNSNYVRCVRAGQ